jgi:chromosome segregation ATPase
MNSHDAEAPVETWRAREAQLLVENEALTGQVQQITADIHELKAECLTKELEYKGATTELELKASQATAAELNMRHQLCVAREKLTVMEDEIRQLSDSNARLAGRCNSVQAEASRASQKLHINQQELSAKLRLLEDQIAGTQDQFRIQLDAQVAEATEFEQSLCNSIADMESQMEALQVNSLPHARF